MFWKKNDDIKIYLLKELDNTFKRYFIVNNKLNDEKRKKNQNFIIFLLINNFLLNRIRYHDDIVITKC